jgi:hypothetical protein
MSILVSGLYRHVDLYVHTSVSEEHAAFIFRAKVKVEVTCFSETVVFTYKSTRQCNTQYFILRYSVI